MAFSKRPSTALLNRLRDWVDAGTGQRSVLIRYESRNGYWLVSIADENAGKIALTPDYAKADWTRLIARQSAGFKDHKF